MIFGLLLGGFRFGCSQYCLKDPQALQLLLIRIELEINNQFMSYAPLCELLER